jgi:GDP/UDP-N,N'-diacetylbacillosamine 2-epimerase (hydrolysing)
MKKKIAIVTCSRSDYAPLSKLVKLLANDKKFNVDLYVTGSHLLKSHGFTIDDIKKDKIKIKSTLKISRNKNTSLSICESVSSGIIKFKNNFIASPPDILLILGDRFEILSSAIAAFFLHIPVAHIAGGHVTNGSVDDTIRHMISKISSLHFTSTKHYADRLMKMGENPSKVFVVGSTSIEEVKSFKFFTRKQLSKKFKIDFKKKIIILMYHPETTSADLGIKNLKNMLVVLKKFLTKDITLIITASNVDEGGYKINHILKKFKKINNKANNIIFIPSLGKRNYFSFLKYAYFVIGNSSSGIIEVPSFKIPTINLGNRQNGRIRQESIIDVKNSPIMFGKALKKCCDTTFRKNLKNIKNIYYKKNSTSRIKIVLEKIKIENLLPKIFYDY